MISTYLSLTQKFGFLQSNIENTDPSLFEADIKLLSEQRFALETTGDIDASVGKKRGITNEHHRLWPGGIVPYNITEDLRKYQGEETYKT